MTTVVWPEQADANNKAHAMSAHAPGAVRTEPVRIVLAGGGTGGHLYPGLAVAEALRAQLPGELELLWAATPRDVDQRLLSKYGDRYIRQPVQPLVKHLRKLWAFWQGWRQTCRFWAAYFREHHVDAVVALGGYAAGPAAHVAAKRGIPVVLLNPDALPGMANRFLLKRADVVITQWPLAAVYEKNIKGRVQALGCPIRPELVAPRTRAEAAAKLGVDPAPNTLVVTGASLGAKTINDAMIAMLAHAPLRGAFEISNTNFAKEERQPRAHAQDDVDVLDAPPPNWQIIHLAGIDQAPTVRAAYAKYPAFHAKVIDYCDDMASLWALADVAIARAGASTCAELTACGVPSILLPYPFHKDMHQRANALELVRAGGAILVDDEKDAQKNAMAIQKVFETLLYDATRRAEMAACARRAGKPHAAQAIAREIVGLIRPSSR
jgi:UDP-N-acetylglucosamine--N-acetylmuramyl-(pentapeptide) pyrophosphoryl-undecaprenol N-acetylglucosamine transferase